MKDNNESKDAYEKAKTDFEVSKKSMYNLRY